MANLIERYSRLGLELNLLGNACLAPSRVIAGPTLGQVELVGHGYTQGSRTHRQTHRYTTVVLFSQLTTVLARHPYGLFAFLGKTGVVDNPGNHAFPLLHRRKGILSHPLQHLFIAPRRVGNQMM